MQFRAGKLTVRKIFEMEAAMPISMTFPQITSADLARMRRWFWSDQLSEDATKCALPLSTHSYLLQVKGQNVLIDTCNGNGKDRVIPFANQLNTPYLDRLRAAGAAPEDIHLVMCTHLHCDHVGWNTRLENGRWVPTFPNARYLFTRVDFEFFRTHQEPVHAPAYQDSVLPVVEHGLAQLVETNHVALNEIGDGLWLQGMPGHSPGNCVIHARSGGELVLFSGDTFHHPVQLVRPDVHFFADEDPVMAVESRTRLMNEHADTATTVFPAHFPHTSGGRILRDGEAFRFQFIG
ncbi:MAG TPA: MBL fold metallo-hydrolase [Steroidobacteraceae bacterium]|nr:MBL fold metallo-hydrolase [Steroidobacteraceae bacterium]